VCDLSFTELVVIVVVAVVVIGPRQLPATLRTVGRWVAKLRNMATTMREESGIDEILRDEGLEKDIQQLRSLLRKGSVLNALSLDINSAIEQPYRSGHTQPFAEETGGRSLDDRLADDLVVRDREYPIGGADTYEIATEDIDPYRVAAEEATEAREATEAAQNSEHDRAGA